MAVWHAELLWQDSEERQTITQYFFVGATMAEALQRAANIAQALVPYSESSLIDCRISLDVDIAPPASQPTGSNRFRLTLLCESDTDPVQQKKGRYRILLLAPVSSILTPDGLKFDPSSVQGQAFINAVLGQTTDLRGNAFLKVVSGLVTKVS